MSKMTLKAARVNVNLTQEQLAKKMKVHRNTVASWGSNPKMLLISEAEKICIILNMKIEQFFSLQLYKM